MVNIGIVGVGFMGVTHFKAMPKVRGGKVAAIVTRDEKKRRGDWSDIQGNFGGSGGVQDLSRIETYATLDELLEDPQIDVVDICLPTSMHVDSALRALRAGKHVFLEKPIALSLRDADRLIAAAERANRQFMVAHVLRYFPEFALVKKLVDEGEHGPVLAAHFKRIIARPAWWDPKNLERTGGPAKISTFTMQILFSTSLACRSPLLRRPMPARGTRSNTSTLITNTETIVP